MQMAICYYYIQQLCQIAINFFNPCYLCFYLSLTYKTWANDHILSSVDQLLSKQTSTQDFSGQRGHYLKIA